MEKKETIFYNNQMETWSYTVKSINTKTLQIEYITKNGFDTAVEAAIELQKASELYANQLKLLKKETGMEYTFTEYLNYWYNNIFMKYTSSNYQSVVKWAVYKLIIPSIENLRDVMLHQVTASYINEILELTITICKSAPRQSRKVIGIAIRDACQHGYMISNPMDEVDRYPEPKKQIVAYKKEHLKLLLQGAKNDANYLEIILGIFCGLRPGETLGLRFSDFNFDEMTLHICRQYTRDHSNNAVEYPYLSHRMSIKPPKNLSSYRKMRVPVFIISEVLKRKEENEKLFNLKKTKNKELYDYVCISNLGRIKADGTVLSALKRIATRQGIPYLTAYDLRHIFASLAIESGADIEILSKMMGHSSVHTTIDTYIGIIDSMNETRKYLEENLDPICSHVSQKKEV